MNDFSIRRAMPGDEETICALLRDFADFVGTPEKYHLTPDIVRRDVLGPFPKLFVAIAYCGDEPAGLANWYWTYSSFATKRELYIEDVYVRPKFRKQGLGKRFFRYLARVAEDEGAEHIDWIVHDWNDRAMRFYKKIGSREVTELRPLRLEKKAISQLAHAGNPAGRSRSLANADA